MAVRARWSRNIWCATTGPIHSAAKAIPIGMVIKGRSRSQKNWPTTPKAAVATKRSKTVEEVAAISFPDCRYNL